MVIPLTYLGRAAPDGARSMIRSSASPNAAACSTRFRSQTWSACPSWWSCPHARANPTTRGP